MAKTPVKIWYDREGDFLEVLFDANPGTFEETADDHVMVRVNSCHEVTGFSIMGLKALEKPCLDVVLEALTVQP